MISDNRSEVTTPSARRAIFAWAMYDFANSGYTTVVLTAIYSAYFVAVIAGGAGGDSGTATLWWTLAIGGANLLVLLSAPVLGAIADHRACKKPLLAVTTVGCIVFTALLGFVGPGEVAIGAAFVLIATLAFATGENLVAAFLPELAAREDMGRISGYGWSLGYLGGLLVLGLCLAYIGWAEARGHTATEFVPVTLWITAGAFAMAALPVFVWLPERPAASGVPPAQGYLRAGFVRVRHTLTHARHYRDLFRFLVSLTVYYCGINTVVVLAAVYAQQVMGFDMRQTVLLILVVNVTAAVGAFLFGYAQDRFGSVRTLAATLILWVVALVIAYFSHSIATFWLVANFIGLALGSSQSAGRALVGQFSPPGRAAEFFGLWGLAGKLAAIIGPVSYGAITYQTHGNHRLALLSTAVFFLLGLVLIAGVDEQRGRAAAQSG